MVIYSERGEKVLKLSSFKPSQKAAGETVTSSVSLRLMQVAELLHSSDEVLAALKTDGEADIHLGRCTFLRVWTLPRETLDIRDHFYPQKDLESPQPTSRGIRLYDLEIHDFFDVLPGIKEVWPTLNDKQPCKSTHGDEIEVDGCYNCNPRIAGTPREKKTPTCQ